MSLHAVDPEKTIVLVRKRLDYMMRKGSLSHRLDHTLYWIPIIRLHSDSDLIFGD